jgi:hypothetical protein
MSSNANLDRFYERFRAHESKVRNGGIDADKPGYHNDRDDLPLSDYSVGQVAADRRGSGSVACANDLTFLDAQAGDYRTIGLYSRRLRDACIRRDMRLWLYGGPILREFIGNCGDGVVYCYVLTGGVPLGVGADAGPDPGRGVSHKWHIHLSWIRQYAQDPAAADAVLSVMLGESLAAWRDQMGDGMGEQDSQRIHATNERVLAMAAGKDAVKQVWAGNPDGVEPAWTVITLKGMDEKLTAIGAALAGEFGGPEQLMAELAKVDQRAAERATADAERDRNAAARLADITAQVTELKAAITAQAETLAGIRDLLGQLDAGTLTQDELVSRIRVSIEPIETDNDGQ